MASSNKQAKVIFTADTKEFTTNITKAKSILTTLKSELKLSEATFKNTGDAVSFYTQKQTLLKQELEQSQQKIENLRSKLEVAKKTFGEGSNEVNKWQTALNRALTEQQQIENSLSECENQLEQYTREQKKAETSLGKLNKTIDVQDKELKELKEQYVNACLQFGKNSKEAKSFANQIQSLSRELNTNQNRLERFEDSADDLDATLLDVNEAVEGSRKGFTVLKGVIADLVANGIRELVQGFKDVSKYVFSTGMDFEEAMDKVQSISGATSNEMVDLTAKAREMGKKTKFSSAEAAEAFSYMGMAGWKSGQMIAGIDGVMTMAAATFTDLGEASDILTDALTGFGESAEEASRYADILTATATNSNTSVTGMGEALKYVSPICKTLGYSMEDTAIAIGLMAQSGVKGSQAGTALRGAFTHMTKDTDSVALAMEKLGISLTDNNGEVYSLKEMMDQLRAKIGGVDVELVDADGNLREYDDVMKDLTKSTTDLNKVEQIKAASTIFGTNAMTGMLAIINASNEDYQKLSTSINTCTTSYGGMGDAAHACETATDNLKGDVINLRNQFDDISLDAYNKFETPMRNAVQNIKKAFEREDLKNVVIKIAESMGNFIEKASAKIPALVTHLLNLGRMLKENKELIIAVGAAMATYFVVGKILVVTSAVTKLINSMKMLGAIQAIVAATNPFTLIAIAVAALVGVFVLLWQKCEGFRNFWIEAWEGIKTAVKVVVDGIKKLISMDMDDIKAKISGGLENLKAKINGGLENLKSQFNGAIENLKSKVNAGIENLKSKINAGLNTVKNYISTGIANIKAKFNAGLNALKTSATTILNGIKTVFTTIFNALKTVLNTIITTMKNNAVARFNLLKTALTTILNGIKTVFTTIFNAIKTALTTIVTTMKDNAIARFNLLKTGITTILNAIKTVATTIFTGIKTVLTNIISALSTSAISKFNTIKTTVTTVFNAIKTTISNVMTTAKNTVKTGIDSIKNLFNFKVELPKVKLPLFSVSGSKNPIDWIDKGVPKISVKWYKDGGIFQKPTLFNTVSGFKGVGEAGAEAVLPIEKLQMFIDNAIQENSHDAELINAINNLANREIKNVLTINDTEFATATATANDHVSGTRLNLSERGVAIV